MRHRNKKKILNRPADRRKALMRGLVSDLFLHGAIKTTEAKAKALMPEAESLITKVKSKLEKKEMQNAVRALGQTIFTEAASKKALEYAQKTKKTSGFTRSTRINYRSGDNALMVMVELIAD